MAMVAIGSLLIPLELASSIMLGTDRIALEHLFGSSNFLHRWTQPVKSTQMW